MLNESNAYNMQRSSQGATKGLMQAAANNNDFGYGTFYKKQ